MSYIYAYELFEAICEYYGVKVGTYPNVNNNTMISTYDNTLTGKQYIMYLAELFGGNAKIERDGSCSIIPLKNYTDIEINALTSKKLEIGDTYELSRVCYNNLIKMYAGGNVITVDKLPTENIDTNSHYYLTTDMKYYKYKDEGGTTIEQEENITVYDVDSNKSHHLLLEGNTLQETRSGKNVLPIINGTYTNNNYSVTIQDNTITPDFTTIAKGFAIFNPNITPITLQAGTYTLTAFSQQTCPMFKLKSGSTDIINIGYSQGNKQTFTLTEATTINSAELTYAVGDTFGKLNIQLEEGNGTNTFEPCGKSPSPDYPSEVKTVTGNTSIKVQNKNLFSSEMELGSILATGELQNNSNCIRTKDYIKIKPNTTYAIQNDKLYTINLYYYDKNYNFISSSSTSTGTFTTLNNAYYFKTRTNASLVQNDLTVKYQLEEGFTATSYVPHQEEEYTISLGTTELCKIGNYKDYFYKEDGIWYVHKEIGKIVLDGSESITQEGSLTNVSRFRFNSLITAKNRDALCNNNIGNSSYSEDFEHFFIATNLANVYYFISTSTASNVNEFKTWLASNNTIIYYVLATPTNTQIADTTLINQLEAIYNISLYSETSYIEAINENISPYIKLKYNITGWQIDDSIENTLYIRPDNIFVSQQSEIDAIYDAIKDFSITNITCENRMDLSLDAWDIVKYITDKGEYYTFYDNTINYNGVAMGTVKVNIPLKVQEETTNVIESQKVINRRVQATINQIDGSISLLSQEIAENAEDISNLEVTAQGISSSVTSIRNDLNENYSTTTEMNSAIQQTADSINLTVSKKIGSDQVVSSINQSSDKISLSSNRFEVNSNNSGIYDYSKYDIGMALASFFNYISLSSNMKSILDCDEDGDVDVMDATKILNIINEYQTNTKNITGKFKIKTDDPKNCIVITKDGETVVSIGCGGINTNMLTTENIVCGNISQLSGSNDLTGIFLNGKAGELYIVKNGVEVVRITPTSISTDRGTIYSATSLYSNTSGTTGSVSLLYSVSNYDFIEIFYKDNGSTYSSVKVYDPDSKVVDLSLVDTSSTHNAQWIKNRKISISGSTISTYSSQYGESQIGNNMTFTYANQIYITKVVGYII